MTAALSGVLGPEVASMLPRLFALLVFAYLVVITYRRLRSGDDPSAWTRFRTETGSSSFLLSGTHLVIGLALLVVGILWPPSTFVLVVLSVIVLSHWIIERRER